MTVTVKTDTFASLNAPSITICPLARLSCRRLASIILQATKDGPSSRFSMNPSETQSSSDTDTVTSSNVNDKGNQKVPATDSKHSSKYYIMHQIFQVAGCCQTLMQMNQLSEHFFKLGCMQSIVSESFWLARYCLYFSFDCFMHG